MLKRCALAFVALFLTAALLPAAPAQAAVTTAQKKARADQLMSMSLSKFLKVANGTKKGVDKTLNWDHDGCSVMSPVPYQGTFYNSCRRHDFAFANYGSGKYDNKGKVKRKQDPEPRKLDPTEHRRLKVNNVFRADMTAVCAKKSGASGTACRAARDKYNHFVNDLNNGSKAFYGTTCDNGYFCAYDDADQKGWRVQFASSSNRLADFAGKDLNDNIKSVWNRASADFRVYKDPSYKGSTQCVTKGKKSTLPRIKLRDEVSSLKRGC